MALNTPKRIKLFDPIVQSSPGSEHNADWPSDPFDDEASVNKNHSGITNPSDVASSNSSTNGNGMCNGNGSLSPVSSCDSPEFSLRNNSNTSSNVSTNSHNTSNLMDNRENRRGRPRSEALTTLMIEGSTSPSSIKCRFCNRVFPREKSLQAHLRTHTGERPYTCDYPGCTRAFTQSGQLKTHQRLHTGERPFMCSAPKCQMRFTHANRHCPEHPYDQLKRCDGYVVQAVTEQNYEVIKWLEKYKMEKEDRTPTRKTPKRTKLSATPNGSENATRVTPSMTEMKSNNENYHHHHHVGGGRGGTDGDDAGIDDGGSDENKCPITPNNPYKSRKGLMVELDMNAGLGASPITGSKLKPQPKVIRWHDAALSQEEDSADEFELAHAQSAFNPKKRWLREVWQNDLARPLDSLPLPNGRMLDALDAGKFNDKHSAATATTATSIVSQQYMPLSPLKQSNHLHHQQQQQQQQRDSSDKNHLNPNQLRPTVLMVASKDRAMPLVNLSPNVPFSKSAHHAHLSPLKANNTYVQQQQQHHHYHHQRSPTSMNFISNSCSEFRQQQQHQLQHQQSSPYKSNGIENENHHLDPKNLIASSTPIVASNRCRNNSTDGTNRKWLGALALMELATEETNQVSSTLPLLYQNSSTN